MDARQPQDSGGNGGRITRRTALAGLGVGLMWPATGVASVDSAERMLHELQAAIHRSSARPHAKRQLLRILKQAGATLRRGRTLDCAQILREQFIATVKHSGGRGGITVKQARRWAADAERLVRALPRQQAGLGATNGGQVTVFNNFGEPITGLSVGGYAVGNISGWSNGGGGPPPYTPASMTVPRSKNPQPGAFAVGGNALLLPWPAFTGEAVIQIPDPATTPVSLDDDLLLYVWTNNAAVVTTQGYVLSESQVALGVGRSS